MGHGDGEIMARGGFGSGSTLRPCKGAEPDKAQEKTKMQPDGRDPGLEGQSPAQSYLYLGPKSQFGYNTKSPRSKTVIKMPTHLGNNTVGCETLKEGILHGSSLRTWV